MSRRNLYGVAVVLVVILGCFAWFNRYHFHRIKVTSTREYYARTNRITGNTEILQDSGWQPYGRKQSPERVSEEPLPDEAREKLQASARINHGTFWCDLYNGSDWRITTIRFIVEVRDQTGNQRLSRTYDMSLSVLGYGCSPLSACWGTENLGFGLNDGDTYTWTIDNVMGYPDR